MRELWLGSKSAFNITWIAGSCGKRSSSGQSASLETSLEARQLVVLLCASALHGLKAALILNSPGEPPQIVRLGTVVPGGMTVPSRIRAQSLMTVNLPCGVRKLCQMNVSRVGIASSLTITQFLPMSTLSLICAACTTEAGPIRT